MRRPRIVLALAAFTLACGEDPIANPPPVTPSVGYDSSLTAYNSVAVPASLPPSAALSGGATTVFDSSAAAFEQPAPNLSPTERTFHDDGDDGFADAFDATRGLGPVFNHTSCEGCHLGDGRGQLPAPGQPLVSMLLRISIPGTNPNGGPLGVPGFGDQLQPMSVPTVPAEASVTVTHTFINGRYGDGSRYSLRKPSFALSAPYAPLPAGVMISPRVAPANFGLGLLEAIPASTLQALSDEFDRNRDGISGKVNVAFDAIGGIPQTGRFGLKANTPSLRQQSAGAYNGDMGITTSIFSHESCEGTKYSQCAWHGIEVPDSILDRVVFYTQTLGVPARRRLTDPTALLGQTIFTLIGCQSCHVGQLATGTLAGVPAVSNQTILPFTDMLVHDVGPGLADNRPDFRADGREWRTPPLWGIGLTQVVNPAAGFLHDGRARDLYEAILWHDGEALASREIFRLLPRSLRDAVVSFLKSL